MAFLNNNKNINKNFPCYDTKRIENVVFKNSSIVACVFAVRDNVFTEPLPSNDRGYTHRLMGGTYEVRR
jgi:hypothetical protein